MKEIAGNLKRDVKDLLNESAGIVAGFFKQGMCTVRGATTRWKDFTREISEAVGTLFQPFENTMPSALALEDQPMVTVMESSEPGLSVGTRMTLYEAEKRIDELHKSYWDSDEPESLVRLAIDYTMEGEQDRYWLPVEIGGESTPMLDQMGDYVTSCLNFPDVTTRDFYNAPEGLGTLLHEHFGPQLRNDLEKLSTKVLSFFRQHSTISRLEQQFEYQAQAMPEKERDKFKRAMRETIKGLRRAANTGQQQPSAPERPLEQAKQPPVPTTAPVARAKKDGAQRSRPSVKVHLRQIKEGQPPAPKPQKGRTIPQR